MDSHYDFRLIRPDDMFVAQLTLTNLVVDADRSRLVRVRPGEPATVELELPTQHFAEPSFDRIQIDGWMPAVVPLFAGSRSRIEYVAPDEIDEFHFHEGGIIEAICDWSTSPGGTWIDVLATLWLHPPEFLRITAAPPPMGAPAPLWSARVDIPTGRPLLMSEYGAGWNLPEGRYGVPLDGSSGHVLRPLRAPGSGRAWRCSKLLLTALGGTVAVRGPDPGIAPIPAYGHTHRTSLGRTSYVRQVVAGHLSSGHAASLVTVAERQLNRVYVDDPTGASVDDMTTLGVLVEDTALVVTDPYVDLATETAAHGPHAFVGLSLTAGERRIVTDDPMSLQWIRDEGGTAIFDLVATDHAGQPIPLRMPLAFIPDGTPPDMAVREIASTAGDHAAPSMATREVAVGPEDGASVTLRGIRTAPAVGRSVPVIPMVTQMTVVVDQLAGLMDTPPAAEFRFHDVYVSAGLDEARNPHGALLQIVPPDTGRQLAVPLPPAAVGAVANPGLKVGALTTRSGAVAGELVRQAVPTLADIRSAFPNATLFGTVDLLGLLADQPFPTAGSRVQLPRVTHRRTDSGEEFAYDFTTDLKAQGPGAGGPAGSTVVAEGARLVLSSTVLRSHGGQVTSTTSGTVTGIGFSLLDIVTLRFGEVRFRSEAGTTSFEIDAPSVEFGAELEFVAELARHLEGLGQGSGVRVDIDSEGVTAGFGLTIPSVQMAVLQLANLSVDAWLRLPFTGAPMAFRLAVASRERPFLVTVSIFGGGGWFALEVSPAGLRRLELGLEFGGSLSLDIIVASGGVTVMAGVYLDWDAERNATSFYAYLRAAGHVSVLGIITVFVEFVLELGYSKRPVVEGGRPHGVLSGRASVTVGVEVLFFSKSVTLTVERTFVGSEADPTFLDCVSRHDWDTYCDAFAPEPAIVGRG